MSLPTDRSTFLWLSSSVSWSSLACGTNIIHSVKQIIFIIYNKSWHRIEAGALLCVAAGSVLGLCGDGLALPPREVHLEIGLI